MKPLALITLALYTLPPAVMAQEASAEVVATVVQDLVLASEGQTSFGTIGNFAHTETIDPQAPAPTQSTALFTASGSAQMFFSCPTSVTLSGPGADMTFTPELSVANFPEGQSVGGAAECPSWTNLNTPVYVWLGGSLAVAADQAPGDYSGTFTLTAAYQ